MILLNSYNIKYNNIIDKIILFRPDSDKEKKDLFRFRYDNYLLRGYIDKNNELVDIDEYDLKEEDVFYICAKSIKNEKIIGFLRIIKTNPLPIKKDCFDFLDPLPIKFFSNSRVVELSRLIVTKYEKDNFLPRHMIMILLIKQALIHCKSIGINFGYAFIKKSLMLKLKEMLFPFFVVKNYKQKYKDGPLKNYFNQKNNPVIPVYFNYQITNLYINLVLLKFKKYIV